MERPWGGKLKPGETPEECVIREVEEESGLMIKNPMLKGVLTFPLFDSTDDWYVFVFIAEEFEGVLEDSPEGELQWIPDDKMLELNLWDGDKIFLKWLEADKFFSAKFVYHNSSLKEHHVVFHS